MREVREDRRTSKNKKTAFLLLLLILLLGITVGFATLSSALKINGTSTVSSSSWDVSTTGSDIVCPTGEVCTINPENPASLTPDDGTGTNPNGAIIWMDGDTIYFKHLLKAPGDVFTFTAKYTNNGSIDAKISSVSKSQLNTTAQSFLTYDVTYANGDPIAVDDELAAGATATFKVTVSYKSTVTTLPTAAQIALINETADGKTGATSSFTVTYVQK